MITDKENIIWNSKVNRQILIELKRKQISYCSDIAEKIKTHPSNILSKFKELKEQGLIELVENKGRRRKPYLYQTKKTKYYRLTEKGSRIVELLLKIDEEVR